MDQESIPVWRLHGKYLLLTYPQCGLSSAAAIEWLKKKIGEEKIEGMVVAEEKHENGDRNLAQREYRKRTETRTEAAMEIWGKIKNDVDWNTLMTTHGPWNVDLLLYTL